MRPLDETSAHPRTLDRAASLFREWTREADFPVDGGRPRFCLLKPLRPYVLVLESTAEGRALLGCIAADRGLETVFVDDHADADAFVERTEPGALAAIVLETGVEPDRSLALVTRVRSLHPGAGVLVTTAHGTEELAVEAFRVGAHDYVHKPLDPVELQLAFTRVLTHRAIVALRPHAAEIA